jgi:hyperosmotically inducible periplasmic protein
MNKLMLRALAVTCALGLAHAASADETKKSPNVGTLEKDTRDPRAPDNTAKNAEVAPTAQDQRNEKSDVELTAQIRRAVVGDKNLSVSAHNVKIITVSGVVTLKGPVKSAAERSSVAEKAKQIAGPANVKNELDIAP